MAWNSAGSHGDSTFDPEAPEQDDTIAKWTARGVGIALIFAIIYAIVSLFDTGGTTLLNDGQFTGITSGGAEIDTRDYQGRVLMVYHQASWCPPCRAAAPLVQELHERDEEGSQLAVLAVNYDETEQDMEAYFEAEGLTFPVIHDGNGRIGRAQGIRAIPTFVVYDHNGEVALVTHDARRATRKATSLAR